MLKASIFDEKKIRKLFENADICINLVGILFESKRGNNFKNIHTVFPTLLAKMCKEYNLINLFIYLLLVLMKLLTQIMQKQIKWRNKYIKKFSKSKYS